MRRLGVVSVHGVDYHPNRRLAQAARERGVELVLMHPFRAWCSLTGAKAGLLGLDPPPPVVLPRVGSTISPYTMALLSHLELLGARLVNRPGPIGLASHQYLCLQALAGAGLPTPDTCLVNRPRGWDQAVERLGGYPLVAKLPQGRQGSGVALIAGPEEAALARELWLRQRRGVLLQRYLPPEGRKDYRVLVLGGRAVAGMELSPAPGEFRANLHLGGAPANHLPRGETARLAEAAAGAVGLEVAGVDLVRAASGELMVMEVNFTPGFKGLEQASGLDAAGLIVDFSLGNP
ncbi:MAG: RimK family alpha-L-glutamate ligase [Desulfarculaceae bacterium]|nr:RimK family alpha-L-glutamate ligase [Desulfarculaceae bacterium]MCF8072697.1 RimK family alpha-L-glutamate ligase [Desulfarculaceae bacterium]MCF8102576.1 RimK family alpha-L-glutamate ligase [Desulfarculaceae bacterium]MCF8116485.1 RimK family alpha-L-glutamate ligase [Desulfarculaceae bacterium]